MHCAHTAKETYPKCQIKQLQLTHYATCDWQLFHNISMASKQTQIKQEYLSGEHNEEFEEDTLYFKFALNGEAVYYCIQL